MPLVPGVRPAPFPQGNLGNTGRQWGVGLLLSRVLESAIRDVQQAEHVLPAGRAIIANLSRRPHRE